MAKEAGAGTSRRELVKATGAAALAGLVSGRVGAAPARARALFFDVGGTMLDWSVMPEKISRYFAERGVKVDGKAFWIPWRTKLFFYMMYNSMIGSGFVPLEELATRSTLAL